MSSLSLGRTTTTSRTQRYPGRWIDGGGEEDAGDGVHRLLDGEGQGQGGQGSVLLRPWATGGGLPQMKAMSDGN